MILPLQKNVQFGLLCVACVPGGGLGHVAVIISKADLPLSLTMNLISTVTMLGKIYLLN
jgi:predicted Na+-dependent transporter